MNEAQQQWIDLFKENFKADMITLAEKGSRWSFVTRVIYPVGPGADRVVLFAVCMQREEA